MLEHTKKPPIELKFLGPAEKREQAVSMLKTLGFSDVSDSISWRDVFDRKLMENEAGTYLAGARHKEGLTQRQLSEKTGIPQRHISEMENGKRTIGKKSARLFGDALDIDYRIFL